MQPTSRRLLDRCFTGLGVGSILLLAAALLVLLLPIIVRGARAMVFRGTVEHRRLLYAEFDRGDRAAVDAELQAAAQVRQPIYDMLAAYTEEIKAAPASARRERLASLEELKKALARLFGPLPDGPTPVLLRDQYGQTRWDRALVKLHDVQFTEEYDYSNPQEMGKKVFVPRAREFEGTALAPLFPYLEANLEGALRPQWTFYGGFFTDESLDAHFFGGIWPEILGTFYLTIGAILFAAPLSVITAVYLVEYASADNRAVGVLRTCISTLAGVPSIVFGLFGLAFFINTLGVSNSKSVLAGSLTLAVLILPVFIRSAEEAIRAVPQTYKEAAFGLGAPRWRTILSIILPASLPGILTGMIISMGRAAGETAPIIFTAAVSFGSAPAPWETLSRATPALPWNIYNLCTEHQAVDEIRHVQYGMVLTLVLLVLLMNAAAVLLRARLARKLRGG